MGKAAEKLYNIYIPNSNLDWMNYKIDKKEDLTFHHIIKREHGGKAEVSNGALLLKKSHNYLHVIEYKDLSIYIAINKIFKIINSQLKEPNLEQRLIIESLLKDFEEQHIEDTNKKGSYLIRRKWLERW